MGREHAAPELDATVGLCSVCRFVKQKDTKRGSTFYRCGRADEDATFPKYPPIPVGRCRGFEDARPA